MAAPAAAQTVYLAFGDSVTFGIGDTRKPPGYPPRLEALLKAEGENIEVRNLGFPGDATIEALSRIDSVLAMDGQCIIIMLGTNDVQAIASGQLSLETAIANLETIVRKSKARGFDVILATIIPRSKDATKDRNNFFSVAFTWRVRELAAALNVSLADPWERYDIANDPDSFETLFSTTNPNDTIGHPNGAGHKAIAKLMADVVQGRDTVPPVPGQIVPSIALNEIPRNSEISTAVYEHATSSGIDRPATQLLINGRVVSEQTEGSTRRKVTLSHKGKKELGCRTVLSVRSQDRADPPNVINRVLKVWDVQGLTVIVGDVDFDCRVDGFDLVSFAYRFGSMVGDERYLKLFDFNRDGRINGTDLSRLARNFGKKSN